MFWRHKVSVSHWIAQTLCLRCESFCEIVRGQFAICAKGRNSSRIRSRVCVVAPLDCEKLWSPCCDGLFRHEEPKHLHKANNAVVVSEWFATKGFRAVKKKHSSCSVFHKHGIMIKAEKWKINSSVGDAGQTSLSDHGSHKGRAGIRGIFTIWLVLHMSQTLTKETQDSSYLSRDSLVHSLTLNGFSMAACTCSLRTIIKRSCANQ